MSENRSLVAARRIYKLYCNSSYFKSIDPEYTEQMLQGWAQIIDEELGTGMAPSSSAIGVEADLKHLRKDTGGEAVS